ncbi:MarR family transcriptional regulator [Glycomyces harbinensis]
MPRMVGRAKRLPVPESVRSLELSPRHLSLLALLLFDGPATVNELAARLEVAPTTVSLMVGDLSRKGVLERREDEHDRRRRIVSITEAMRPEIEEWLAGSAAAWRTALAPLTAEQRRVFVDTLLAYERALDSAAR